MLRSILVAHSSFFNIPGTNFSAKKSNPSVCTPLRLKNRWPKLSEQDQESWLNKASGSESTAAAPAPAASVSSSIGVKRRKTSVATIANLLQELPSPTDAAEILVAAVQKIESIWPGFADQVMDGMKLKLGQDAAECARCAKLLEGIFSLPGFAAPYPDEHMNIIRHSMDNLVRKIFGDRDAVNRLGYAIGKKRWSNALQDMPAARCQRGQPSQVNNPENVAKVKELLE